MAKTNWVLDEYVMPTDMNQIGTEINAKAEKNNIETTGYSLRDNRFSKRFLGSFSTINSSPNQKIKITFPTNPTSYNFNGDIKLSVGGGFYGTVSNGVVSKKFSGTVTNSGAIEFDSRYTELSGRIFDKIKISDMRFDAVNKQAFILVEYIPNINNNQQFSFDIEVNERGVSSPTNFKNFFTGITIGSWYADTEVLPHAYVQERQLQLTAPQGTAPLVVTSNTKVENLNSDFLDGLSSEAFYKSATQLASGTDLNTILREGNFYTGSVAIASSIVNSPSPGSNFNLQVKMLGANLFHQIASVAYNTTTYDVYFRSITSSSVSSWRKMLFEGLPVNGSQLISAATQGTAPLVVTSNTKVDNLNSDLLDGFHASQNKDVNTVAVRRDDGSLKLGGYSELEQVGFKLPGRNRELRITQDANNISYIQLVNDTGGFIANPIQVNSDGTVGFNVSTNVIAYNNPNTPQVRNTHVGNTAPSNSLGLNGDMYIEV